MTTLVELNPIDPGTGNRVTLRVCAQQDPDATGASGHIWWPAITVQPVLAMTFFDGAFSSSVSVAQASMEIRLDVLRNSGQFARAERYDWSGATAIISRLVSGSPVQIATMRVERFTSENDRLALSLSVDEEPLEGNVLFSEYAGTTGLEGTADLKGKPKPWAFGRCSNVEPAFIDKIDNVFQVSGYGPVQAIPAVYERGASFGASLGDYASYANLAAANIPEGRWGTCLAQGLIRLGAPPAGVITCDVDGDNTGGFLRRTGAIIKEIASRKGISAKINATSLDALDAAVARDVNIYITQQTSLLDLARRMAAPCNAVAGVALDGRLITPRVAFGSEQFTLDAQGREMPPVLGMARKNTSPPFDEIKLGANRSWRVHTFDEVAFYAELIDRGLFDAATVYREGNIIALADKSRWLYINPAATAGNMPPTWPTVSNAFWSNLEPPLNPTAIGVEAGATRTVARGTYDNATTYVRGDEVLFSGSTYRLIVESSTGNAPPDAARWALIAQAGSGPAGADGLEGLTIFLTNEAHVVSTAQDGSGGNYAAAGGQMQLLRGGTSLAATFSIPARTPSSSWISIDPSTGVFTVTDPGVDLATATIRAAWSGVNYDRTYTLAKSRAGAPGANGTNGTNGTNGLSSAAVFIYKRAPGEPTDAPANGATYTFATGVLTGTLNGWTTTIPANNGNPVWVRQASASGTGATDTIDASEWSAVRQLAADGAQGDAGGNTAVVFIYARAASAPAAPTGATTYTFSTGVLSGTLGNGWTQAVPAANGQPLWVRTAVAFGTGTTDSIAAAEWSGAQQLSADGAAGLNQATVFLYRRSTTAPPVPSVTSTYTFATGVLTGQNNSWVQSVPSGTDPIYVISANAIGTGPTDTILSGEWSTPQILAQNGATGAAGTPAVTGFLTNEAHTVFAFANGNVVSYTGATGSFRVFQGNTDVSTSFSLSTQANPQSLTVSYTGQTYTVTGGFANADDTASLTIRATGSGAFVGVTIDKVFTLAKTRGGYEIVGSLPATNLFAGRVVFLTSDNKLYRYTGSAWTTAVPAPDIAGQLTDAQIAALAAAKLTGQITTTQITDNAISTPKLAAGAVVAGKIAAKSITASKLLVAPHGLNPDPLIQDPSFWQIDSNGWYIAEDPGGWFVPVLGYFRAFVLWDGFGFGSSRRHVWTDFMPFNGRNEQLRLRAQIINASNQHINVEVQVYDDNQAYLAAATIVTAPNSGGQVGNVFLNVPNGASFYRLVVYNQSGINFGGIGLVTNVRLDNAADASLIVDGAIVADKIASDAVTANKIVAGAVTAAKINVTSLSAINANIGEVTAGLLRSSSNQARIELDNARIIFNNGSFMKVTGIGFGSSNQFIEWSGPSQANLANCTEANAVSYLKVNGEAYFGGTLSAGARKNAIQGTGIAADAEVILGPFGSITGSRVVVSSFGFLWAGQHTDTGVGAGSSSSTATLILERRTTGAWTQVVSFNVTINKTWTQSFGPGEPGSVTISGNGSNTTTDTAEITTNMEYRLRLSSRPLPAGGPTPDGQISQTLGIVSTQG